MNWTIWIHGNNNFPISDDTMSAYIGYKNKGGNIKFFEEIEEVPVSRYNLIVGFVEDTTKYLNFLGIEVPKTITMPDELIKYAGRNIEKVTLGEFKKNPKFPIFIKPNRFSKEFISGVIKKENDLDLYLNHVTDDTPIITSEVVTFVSEWRGYVINNESKEWWKSTHGVDVDLI